MFNFFKKRKEKNKMTTLEEVRKAYNDLSEDDKKTFHQSIADRVHESVAAQERDDGTEDSQTAKDREHEALGAEHADGKGEVEELHETDGNGETVSKGAEKLEESGDDVLKQVLDRLTAIEAKIASTAKEERDSDKLDEARKKYGMASSGSPEGEKKPFTEADVKKLLG